MVALRISSSIVLNGNVRCLNVNGKSVRLHAKLRIGIKLEFYAKGVIMPSINNHV